MDEIINKYQTFKMALKQLHQRYENALPAVFFSFGFILDILTLGEVDDLSNILVLGFYLISSLFILSLEFLDTHKKEFKNKWVNRAFEYRDDIFHFLCGSLLSAFTLFYFKSGSVANSFLFMIFMMSILLLNEVEYFQKQGAIIRSAMMMLCFISYLIYVVPIILGTSSSFIFYICILIAVVISTGCFFVLTYFNQEKEKNIRTLLIPQLAVGIIFISLYGLKIVPPMPLSLKYIGIFHDVEKINGEYRTKDQTSWWNFWDNGDQSFKARAEDKIYLFTNIFAPGGFAGKVYIHWLKDTDDGLKTSDRIPLKITGGRTGGFRGYAYKSNYAPGLWQVRVESDNGLEIGRINFEVTPDKSQTIRNFNQVSR